MSTPSTQMAISGAESSCNILRPSTLACTWGLMEHRFLQSKTTEVSAGCLEKSRSDTWDMGRTGGAGSHAAPLEQQCSHRGHSTFEGDLGYGWQPNPHSPPPWKPYPDLTRHSWVLQMSFSRMERSGSLSCGMRGAVLGITAPLGHRGPSAQLQHGQLQAGQELLTCSHL